LPCQGCTRHAQDSSSVRYVSCQTEHRLIFTLGPLNLRIFTAFLFRCEIKKLVKTFFFVLIFVVVFAVVFVVARVVVIITHCITITTNTYHHRYLTFLTQLDLPLYHFLRIIGQLLSSGKLSVCSLDWNMANNTAIALGKIG